jgi:large subunit ribosomal protein L6
MSRIGNRVLTIPEGVTVTNDNNLVTVKGPKGELSRQFREEIVIEIKDSEITTKRTSEIKTVKQLHGTTNALISNMLTGVSEGYVKELEIIGVGYRFQLKGNTLVVNAGYSHPVELTVPAGITAEVPSNTELKLSGINNEILGEFAANVRKVRKPEPYKGKGIRYKDEYVRRKEGKKAA